MGLHPWAAAHSRDGHLEVVILGLDPSGVTPLDPSGGVQTGCPWVHLVDHHGLKYPQWCPPGPAGVCSMSPPFMHFGSTSHRWSGRVRNHGFDPILIPKVVQKGVEIRYPGFGVIATKCTMGNLTVLGPPGLRNRSPRGVPFWHPWGRSQTLFDGHQALNDH